MKMNISLVGLSAREDAALTIFIGMSFKGSTCKTVAFRPGLALPPADLYIIDLAGVGLAQWSVKAEADLLTLLGGSHALLLNFPNNISWVDKGHHCSGRQTLACLSKPYSSENMRGALARFGAGGAASAAVGPSSVCAAVPAPAFVSTAAFAPVFTVAPLAPVAAARLVTTAVPALPLRDSLQALRTLFPELQQHLLLARLLDMVATQQPQELRLTLHHSIVVHPAEGWVSHNAAPGMLERFAQDSSAATMMSVRTLDASQAQLRAGLMGSPRASLDTFLWLLAESSIGAQTPPVQRDAELKLSSMPGFTRIPGVDNLFLQLAAICVRLPQTLSSLRAVFPQHDPSLIARFMLLATASGLGELSLVTGSKAFNSLPSPVPQSRTRASSGFFRAMFQKLF
ncbi:MAG: hypothetical protein NTZ64_11390 [Polaromonas sp.]|nr:hypothetical protein [Polaromonas sp.]